MQNQMVNFTSFHSGLIIFNFKCIMSFTFNNLLLTFVTYEINPVSLHTHIMQVAYTELISYNLNLE